MGIGEDAAIGDVAKLIGQVVGYRGRIEFDTSKPGGTPRELLDVSKLRSLGWQATVPPATGLEHAYRNFIESGER